MAEIKLSKRIKYASDVYNRLIECGFDEENAILFLEGISDADVAPVVHGQWLDNVDYMFCSKCGMQWNYYDNDTQDFKYCPNCGAKMDEGE